MLHSSTGWENNLEKLGIIWLASEHSLEILWSIYSQRMVYNTRVYGNRTWLFQSPVSIFNILYSKLCFGDKVSFSWQGEIWCLRTKCSSLTWHRWWRKNLPERDVFFSNASLNFSIKVLLLYYFWHSLSWHPCIIQ